MPPTRKKFTQNFFFIRIGFICKIKRLPSMKKPIIFVSLFFLIFSSASLFVYLNIHQANVSKDNKDFLKKEYSSAIEHMKHKRYKEAYATIKSNSALIYNNLEDQKKWFSLLVDVSAELNEVRQLAQLYDFDPNLFIDHEKASLQLASFFLLTGKIEKFNTLRERWIGREAKEWDWLNNDVEYLVLEGKRDEAIRLINAKSFSGKDEEQRLLLLSMLYAHEQPEKALDYLAQVLKQNPKNSSALSFRASLYEKMNYQDEAFEDYLMALIVNPYNSLSRSKLANYYFKNLQYSKAIDLYENSLEYLTLTDQLLLKLLFWNKVFKPIDFEWEAIPIPNTSFKPFLKYLMALNQGQFWNNQEFKTLVNQKEFLNSQESSWLKLISYLSKGNEFYAEDLLNSNVLYEQPWNKDLLILLKGLIDYRKSGSLDFSKTWSYTVKDLNDPASHFIQLLKNISTAKEEDKNFEISQEDQMLLKGPLAFPLVFLSLGWNEAALQLNPLNSIPQDYPDWVPLAFAKAIEVNRGYEGALTFLNRQKSTDRIEVAKLKLKLLLNLEEEEELLTALNRYANHPGDVGFEASKLIALIHFSNDHFTAAEQAVNNNAILKRHPDGGEIIAKIALAEGDFQKANLIYSATENLSLEAQSFLARRAFSEKNWTKAKELTLNLLKNQPINPVLQNNYLKILEFMNIDKK